MENYTQLERLDKDDKHKFYTKDQLNLRQTNQRYLDDCRTKELLEKGFKVMRIWECEIRKMDLNDFKQRLMEVNNEPY